MTLTEPEVRTRAARRGLPPQVICTTCGEPSYTAAHFGHRVTRLPQAPTSVAPRVKTPARPPIEWITVYDAARELGVSKMTVYRLVHTGELPAHRIGRGFRIKREVFNAYVAGTLVLHREGTP